jgi:hypothetical protein
MPNHGYPAAPTPALSPHISPDCAAEHAERVTALEQERDTARKARDAWREFARHLWSCYECGEFGWPDCSNGRQLRDACKVHDAASTFPEDGLRQLKAQENTDHEQPEAQ